MPTIRELRLAKGWTQDKLARETGVQLATVSSWETGRKQPSGLNLQALARALGVSADDIDLSVFELKDAA